MKLLAAHKKKHSALGPGLLESTYEVYELEKSGLKIETQKALPCSMRGDKIRSRL